MNKCLKLVIISLLLIIALPMAKLSAQVSTWDGTHEPWAHGTGTEADPFLIENAQQLAYLAYRVNNGLDAGGGHVSNHDLHYKLMVDVDLNGSETFQWTPIGYWNSDTDYQCFGGHFDGNNHTISRLFINSSVNRVGFFGYTDESVVRNITINGTKISSSGSIAGGIIGVANGTIITNCISDLIDGISCSGYAGGIVGVYYCTSSAQAIINCYNTGNINTNYISGGIVGQIGLNCNNGGNNLIVTNNFNTGIVSALWRGGGIVGYVVGENYCNNLAIITNCFNIGNVLCSTSSSSNSLSGGIVGSSNSSNILFTNISNCYNTGIVSAYHNKGGIIGFGTCNIVNSYFLNSCGGDNTYGGQPMSSDAMQSAEFVTILNAGSLTYKKDNQPYINQGYPVFSGFNIETQPASDVELTSAILNSSYTSGIFNITSQGFEYKKTTDQNYTTVNCNAGQTPFSYELNGLESGATYQYRAFAIANEGTAYGELVEFTTTTINTHQIYANYSNGPGIITPNGYVHVIDGEDQTFEISAIEQSILDSVCVDGTNVGPVTSYTFHNVNGDHTIYAYFTLIATHDLEPWDGATINEPFSFENKCYICSPTELAWVAQQTNNGDSFSEMSFYLMNDIDLGGAQTIPSIWTPIGTSSRPFCGWFSGRNNRIKNLYCNSTEEDDIGLFGYAENAYLGFVHLRNVNITGKSNVGGLVGHSKNTRHSWCNVTGQIIGISNVGGLAGNIETPYHPSSCYGCFASVELEAEDHAGGLIGIITNAYRIEWCFSMGMVHSQNTSGGLIGCVDINDNALISITNIKECYSNATVLGLQCGGLIGERVTHNNSYLGTLNISDTYVSGSVKNGYGFISNSSTVNGTIANCVNCFFDSQVSGCGDNGIIGVSPKKTNEMTSSFGFGMNNDYWLYVSGLYPQLTGYAHDTISQLSVSPIFLQNNENSSAVHSNFQVSTANGVSWSSSNPDAIAINGSYASVNPSANETVTLTATLNGISKQINITVADPNTFLIYEPSDLRFIAEQCNAGETFEGKCVKLMNDIVLPENVPNNMISIGSYPNHPFKGTFDGNEKIIYNLYIDQPNTPYQGFFGYTLNANLYNVGLVNITASGRNYTGGMVAYAKNTHLRDCYVNGGTLFALSYCGGLIGYQEQGTNSIVSGCYNTCSVSGNHYVGGLIGFSNYSTVRNSYVAGPVSGQGNGIGAIIGGANEVLMYYCYFSIEMTGQTNAIGENNIGGGKDSGEGLTNAQMRDPQFVATLNQGLVTPVWMADYASHINNGFPIIKWQRPGTGVEENNVVKNYVSIYPNPANGFVTIQSDDPSVSLKQLEIYDVTGRKVMSEILDGQSQELSITKLLSGIYYVRIQTDNGCYTDLKLVVQ